MQTEAKPDSYSNMHKNLKNLQCKIKDLQCKLGQAEEMRQMPQIPVFKTIDQRRKTPLKVDDSMNMEE